MNIEIVTTLNDDFKETGFGALKACTSVLESIKRLGHQARLNVCTTEQSLNDVVKRQPDLVILAVKYIVIESKDDIWLSEFFARKQINYSGSSREVLKFDSNKVLAKSHLRKKGIRTANYFTATPGQYMHRAQLPIMFPLFLKPSDAANGNGVDDLSFVTNFSEFEQKIAALYAQFDMPILVEEYLNGQEFTVAVAKTLQGDLVVSPVEIVPVESTNGLRILGEKAKRDDSEELIRALHDDLGNRVKRLAIDAFVGLGIRDFGRIDIKTNKRGDCFFMEANLVPGMTFGSSYFPRACAIEHGLSYDKVIELILEEGLGRVPATAPAAKKRVPIFSLSPAA